MDYDKEIERYEKEVERLKTTYLQCLGIVQYLKQQKELNEKKEEKEEGK